MSEKQRINNMDSKDLEKISGGFTNANPLCPRCNQPLSRALYLPNGGANIPVWNCERCEGEWNSLYEAPPDNDGFDIYMWPLDFFHASDKE